MNNSDLVNKAYEISDKYNIFLKGSIIISGDVNCILFAYYCKSTLFYKEFFNVSRSIFNVNRIANNKLYPYLMQYLKY